MVCLLVQFSNIVPGCIIEPGTRFVHLCLTIQHYPTAEKEVVLIEVEFGGGLKDLCTHLEGKE